MVAKTSSSRRSCQPNEDPHRRTTNYNSSIPSVPGLPLEPQSSEAWLRDDSSTLSEFVLRGTRRQLKRENETLWKDEQRTELQTPPTGQEITTQLRKIMSAAAWRMGHRLAVANSIVAPTIGRRTMMSAAVSVHASMLHSPMSRGTSSAWTQCRMRTSFLDHARNPCARYFSSSGGDGGDDDDDDDDDGEPAAAATSDDNEETGSALSAHPETVDEIMASFQDTSYVMPPDDDVPLSSIHPEFKAMSNEELSDTSTIPGWDLIHSPPGKLPKGALVGHVVSTKMQKTVNVAVERYKLNRKYRKRLRYTRKFMAHDEKEVASHGDLVMIVPCHRISKHKHFMLQEIIRAKGQL